MSRSLCRFALLLATLALPAADAFASEGPNPPPHIAAPDRPSADARSETVGGQLESLRVHDQRHGTSLRYFALRQADGTRLAIRWLTADASVPGATVQLDGRRTDGTLFVDRAQVLRGPEASFRDAPPLNAQRYEGTLDILHADHPDADRCEVHYVLRNAAGAHLRIDFPVVPDILEPGMALAVDGVAAADGLAVVPSVVTIMTVAQTPHAAEEGTMRPAISGTTNVLVILVKYADTASEPYTQAQVANTVFGASGSVADFFRESSYGAHTLAGTVTPWLRTSFARPATCNYSRVSTEAMSLARAAGYALASYQKFVFVFPALPGCGWMGLGGGSYAWINQHASVFVIGHELGHTFGLGHASSLACTSGGVATTIEGTCTRSEYGDVYAIMGGARTAHFSAPHKVQLGHLPASTHKVHRGGTTTYALAPIEVPGGSTYAVKIPASSQRTYWIEWRQPIGFDAAFPTGVTAGALVHTGHPSANRCVTCLIDMTPGVGGFSDAALGVGRTFSDTTTGTTISVLSATASQLSVRVTAPTRTAYTDVPATHSAYAAIETLAWHGIAVECAPNAFCPDRAITRAETAAFLERAKRGASYAFAATGTRFADVPVSHWAVKYIEQLHIDGITNGCAGNPLRYCPDMLTSRAQMAALLLRARLGSTLSPGTASGTLFGDVPSTHPMAAWIERLYGYQITLGCSASPRLYCPDAPVTRAQMALFIQRAFGLAGPS